MTESVASGNAERRIGSALSWLDVPWAAAPLERGAWGDHAGRVDQWLAAGMHGSMDWIAGSAAGRREPWSEHPWARSCLVALMPCEIAACEPRGEAPVVAGYARERDYHHRAQGLLSRIADSLEREFPGLRSLRFCDELALPEVELAVRSGLGWRGRNSLLLTRQGSAHHVLGLLTDLEGIPPPPPHPDRCGSCTACIDACPSRAIAAPGLVDARLCLSHWNIEDRETSEGAAAAAARGEVFGCDICQSACPWNRKVPRTPHPGEWPRGWAGWNRICAPGGGFQSLFGRTPLRRAGRHKVRKALLRSLWNVDPAEALAQSGLALLEESHPPLRTWLRSRIPSRPECGRFALVGSGASCDALRRAFDLRGVPTGTEPDASGTERPRRILLVPPPGEPTERTVVPLLSGLEPGDVVADFGDGTVDEARALERNLSARGIRYLDAGTWEAPGEADGRFLFAAGGSAAGWWEIAPVLEAISATTGISGDAPACVLLGPAGSGRLARSAFEDIGSAVRGILSEASGLRSALRGVAGVGECPGPDDLDRVVDAAVVRAVARRLALLTKEGVRLGLEPDPRRMLFLWSGPGGFPREFLGPLADALTRTGTGDDALRFPAVANLLRAAAEGCAGIAAAAEAAGIPAPSIVSEVGARLE